MTTLIVASRSEDWPFDIPNVDIVDEWTYLTGTTYSDKRNVKVLNLCRSYKYQSSGYYVSLLAEARGHTPLPSIQTLLHLKSQSLIRVISEELDALIQKSLAPLHSNNFTLSVYFGRNMASRYERLCQHLFNQFPIPLLRVRFARSNVGQPWLIRSVKAISGADVPASHRDFVAEAARRHFAGRFYPKVRTNHSRYDLAILHNPAEENSPSDEAALKKFAKAGQKLGIYTELITKDDYGRLLEFDALFIRETTAMTDHTYRFARRAASEGLVVIDDPQSIARCTNKVFLAELLMRYKVPIPRTLLVHDADGQRIAEELGFPCVLKKPDSSFSVGVVKVSTPDELKTRLKEFLAESELVVVQEYLPTEFDWRIGIVDGKALYACKYFMAPGHWQIIQHEQSGRGRYGKYETIPIELAPRKAVSVAMKAAALVGDGLYGVDVKQSGGQFYVIEVNDNPNLDHGVEDQILRDELYDRIMNVFLARIERQKSEYRNE